MFAPATVHFGRLDKAIRARQAVLDQAWVAHPERFINGPPTVPVPSAEVWINRPVQDLPAAPQDDR
ncbi:MAG: putative transposase [Myxococcota bacterium]|jgi:putative transposase